MMITECVCKITLTTKHEDRNWFGMGPQHCFNFLHCGNAIDRSWCILWGFLRRVAFTLDASIWGFHEWWYPKNRRFISWNIPLKLGWWLGVPLFSETTTCSLIPHHIPIESALDHPHIVTIWGWLTESQGRWRRCHSRSTGWGGHSAGRPGMKGFVKASWKLFSGCHRWTFNFPDFVGFFSAGLAVTLSQLQMGRLDEVQGEPGDRLHQILQETCTHKKWLMNGWW